MATNENKETIRRFANIVNSGEFASLGEICDDNFVYRSSAGEEFYGVDGIEQLLSTYHEAFTDFEVTPEELIAEGNKVFGTYRQTGTHTGNLMGIEASNNEIDIQVASLCTFENGKLVEEYDIYDTLDFLKQLGAVSEDVRPGGAEWPSGGKQLRPQG